MTDAITPEAFQVLVDRTGLKLTPKQFDELRGAGDQLRAAVQDAIHVDKETVLRGRWHKSHPFFKVVSHRGRVSPPLKIRVWGWQP